MASGTFSAGSCFGIVVAWLAGQVDALDIVVHMPCSTYRCLHDSATAPSPLPTITCHHRLHYYARTNAQMFKLSHTHLRL